MLFQREQITPQGRLQALEALFGQLARRNGASAEPGHVPVDILEAYGELNSRLRFLLEAELSRGADSQRRRQLKHIERELDALPESIMETLPAGPEGNWLGFYRHLVRLHTMLGDAQPELEEEEYGTIIRKMVQLAARVSQASAVDVNAASMFSLLLIQVELHHQDAARLRKPRRKKRRRSSRKATKKAVQRSSAD